MTLAVRLCQWLVSDATAALCATLAILVIVYLAKKVRAIRLLPPGPQGYPILGILPMIKKEFHLMLFDLSKMYGNIFSLKMGSQTVVVLSDYETIKKAFRSRDFVARPKSELSTLLNGYGIINAEGALWKSNRRYLINQKLGMRHWGQGMEQIEQCVQREVTCLVQALLQEHELVPVNPAPLFNCAVANVICSMIMSVRFRHDDPKFQRFMFLFDDGFRLFASTGAACFIPVLRYLPGVQTTFGKLRANREEMLTFVREIITEHKQSLDPDHPRDLIDTYLAHMQQNARTEDLFHGFEAEQQMEQVVLDLFSAGVETLKTSLLWSMVFMLHNPEVKRKVQEELDSVVGSDRMPQIEDMQHTPYTRATILEVLRRSSVVPMGTTHATDRSVTFEGYTLPQNTHVIPLLHAIHMDPKQWHEPEAFRPERFLSEDGVEVVRPEHFIPFGIGQRMCLGDQLAEKEFYLFFASLLHAFDVAPAAGAALPSLRGVAAVTVMPNDFEVVFTPRHAKAVRGHNPPVDSWAHVSRIYG